MKDELAFYIEDAEEINKKYSGKHIAIIDKQVVASGNDPKEVWEQAKKKYPKKQPVLAFVPKEDTLVLAIG
jgi:glycine betaine/choline ABC-type transport system substrate-binding protein